jgi:hypothetical protein
MKQGQGRGLLHPEKSEAIQRANVGQRRMQPESEAAVFTPGMGQILKSTLSQLPRVDMNLRAGFKRFCAMIMEKLPFAKPSTGQKT